MNFSNTILKWSALNNQFSLNLSQGDISCLYRKRLWKLLLHQEVVWAQECGCNLSKNGHNPITSYDAQRGRCVC